MTAALQLRVCAAEPPPGTHALFPADGEFTVAWHGLRKRGIVVPMPLMLELYCYEFLERLREAHERAIDVELHAPFDPVAALLAGDVEPAGSEVLVAMCPARLTTWQPRSSAEVAACAASLFACLPFDPDRYVSLLADRAVAEEWRRA